MGQIRILQSATHMEMDFEGQTEAAAMYTLLVISSLSIIDNMIGIMVATRRSLKLTQVAFAIWCLRFLFRTLSLISVGFMLAFSAVFQRGSSLTPATPELPDKYDNGPNFETTGRNQSTTMYTITALEIIVALIHGWSLLVLIRDLRSQPRPRTVIVRLWTWFCGTKLGYRLGLGQYSRYHPYIHHGGAGIKCE
ncbi:hypothetical protein FBU30_011100 [Linnemannia zychae]|nr:hypothetical protein FBU30_011100 [Linnemannia zychae]